VTSGGERETMRLTRDEACGVMLAAQGLLDPPPEAPGLDDVRATIERLGVVQVDTISVVERSQYLVLWSRLGAYDAGYLDALVYPQRAIFEYWSHAASIVPMADYRYYRPDMLRAAELHMWAGDREWVRHNSEALRRTLDTIRERGPMTSSQFERAPEGQRGQAWDWYGPKESRRALAVAWMLGDLMIHSRRAGQKVYDLRERVLAEAFGDGAPGDDELPTPGEQLRYFTRRTVQALGVVTSTWLLDYFRIRPYLRPNGNGGDAGKNGKNGNSRAAALTLLEELAREGVVAPVRVAGLSELAYLAVERLPDLERLRSGEAPARTTLLAPFDSLIWDRARTRALFDYEVSFEAYVLPAKRRYGYYCLAILHHGRLVGRVDTKAQRDERTLLARAVYLEQGIVADDALLDGLAGALGDLARFLKLEAVRVERSEPAPLAKQLSTRVAGKVASQRARAAKARRAASLA
jgi:uncharacterized protein